MFKFKWFTKKEETKKVDNINDEMMKNWEEIQKRAKALENELKAI